MTSNMHTSMSLRGAIRSPALLPWRQVPNSQQLSIGCLKEGPETSECPELNFAVLWNTDMFIVVRICSVYQSWLLKAWSPVQQDWRWASVNCLEDEGSGFTNGLIHGRIRRLMTSWKWQEMFEVRSEGHRFPGLAFTGCMVPLVPCSFVSASWLSCECVYSTTYS